MEKKNPRRILIIPKSFFKSPKSLNLKITAPKIAGIESKNENLKAFILSIPSISPVEIVAPLLEMPGIIAIPWAMPIRIELIKLRFSLGFFILL
ncbi:MAG: hypothetical protein M1426_03445 [Patescibacteria group bacterium]|nr:hypothetical protein [Patescibacteria group bacterium]